MPSPLHGASRSILLKLPESVRPDLFVISTLRPYFFTTPLSLFRRGALMSFAVMWASFSVRNDIMKVFVPGAAHMSRIRSVFCGFNARHGKRETGSNMNSPEVCEADELLLFVWSKLSPIKYAYSYHGT